MNKERRNAINEIKNFNNGWKKVYSQKLYDRRYNKLSKDERLNIDDIIDVNKE